MVIDPQLLRIIRDHPHGILVLAEDSGQIVHANSVARQLLRGDPTASLDGDVLGLPLLRGRSTLVEIGPPVWRRVRMTVEEVNWGGRLSRFVTLRSARSVGRTRQSTTQQRQKQQRDEDLSLLAHELRAPLASILGAVYAARLAPARQDAALTIVEHQARRLGRLLEDLVDSAGLDTQAIPIRPVPLVLDSLVGWTAEAIRPILAARSQRLDVVLPEEPIVIAGDPTWLEQALIHLLSNASKYSESGGSIRVEATREHQDAVIYVQDDGIGIDSADLPLIFDPFHRGEGQGVRLREGMGVGLAMVRRIVERHGGTVSAGSAGTGLGSIFSVRLPTSNDVISFTQKTSPDPTQVPSALSASVIIVEDDPATAEGLAQVLRLWGCRVRIQHNGPSAVFGRPGRSSALLGNRSFSSRNRWRYARPTNPAGTIAGIRRSDLSLRLDPTFPGS